MKKIEVDPDLKDSLFQLPKMSRSSLKLKKDPQMKMAIILRAYLRSLSQIDKADHNSQKGGNLMIKRCLQVFLLLIVVMSSAALAGASSMIEEEVRYSVLKSAKMAVFKPGYSSLLFEDAAIPILNLLGFNRCRSSVGVADWNRASVDESLLWAGTDGYVMEYGNQEEPMSSETIKNDENLETETEERSVDENSDNPLVAMKKLDFFIGKWEGEGWLV